MQMVRRKQSAAIDTITTSDGAQSDAFAMRAGVLADRSHFVKDLAMPFYGANRAEAKALQRLRDFFCRSHR